MSTARKALSIMVLAAALFITQPADSPAYSTKVPAEVAEKAENDGAVLVLVGLSVPWQMEGTLTDDGVQAQREAIAVAQQELLAELAGTHHRVVRQYEEIPGIALEVGSEALAIVDNSSRVTNVLLDRPALASVNPSQPAAITPAKPSSTSKVTVMVPASKIPLAVLEKARNGERVLVLVGLKAPWLPEGPLSDAQVTAQRNAIAASQEYLLVELVGTHYKVTRLYRRIPGIALEVGADALKVLASSPAVTNVLEDRPPRPK